MLLDVRGPYVHKICFHCSEQRESRIARSSVMTRRHRANRESVLSRHAVVCDEYGVLTNAAKGTRPDVPTTIPERPSACLRGLQARACPEIIM